MTGSTMSNFKQIIRQSFLTAWKDGHDRKLLPSTTRDGIAPWDEVFAEPSQFDDQVFAIELLTQPVVLSPD